MEPRDLDYLEGHAQDIRQLYTQFRLRWPEREVLLLTVVSALPRTEDGEGIAWPEGMMVPVSFAFVDHEQMLSLVLGNAALAHAGALGEPFFKSEHGERVMGSEP